MSNDTSNTQKQDDCLPDHPLSPLHLSPDSVSPLLSGRGKQKSSQDTAGNADEASDHNAMHSKTGSQLPGKSMGTGAQDTAGDKCMSSRRQSSTLGASRTGSGASTLKASPKNTRPKDQRSDAMPERPSPPMHDPLLEDPNEEWSNAGSEQSSPPKANPLLPDLDKG
jgi:hypothetical protein